MDIVAPPTAASPRPDGERRGLVVVHTGHGKGKSPPGRPKGSYRSAKHEGTPVSTAAFGLALRAHGRGKAVKIYQFMKVPSARFGEHRVFEQLGVPIEGLGDGFSWLPLEPVLACLRARPPHVHVLLTGRNAPEELIALPTP